MSANRPFKPAPRPREITSPTLSREVELVNSEGRPLGQAPMSQTAKPQQTRQITGFNGEDEVTDPGIAPTPSAASPSSPPPPPQQAAPLQQTSAAAIASAPSNTPKTGKMPDLGPLNVFMGDPTITEIMINDIRNVMIEREGKMSFSGLVFTQLDELNRLTRAILDVTGRVLSPDQPYIDVMLPDGSRVNIIAPPLTLYGPCITIRKFPTKRYTANDLIRSGMVDQRVAYFLNACVLGRINILICGGTGSGKTTLLGVLCSFIGKSDRIVTIEDTPELSIEHANSVRLQTKPQSPMLPAIHARELLANSLRMRPDRIIIGECRRGEAFDILQAMNTGHAGSMTTIHANSARDGLTRMETLCMLASSDLPLGAIRRQISEAIDLVVYIKRFRDGKRRIVQLTEVTGMEGEIITSQDILIWDQEQFKLTGLVPTFVERLRENGIALPPGFFAG